MSNLRAALVWRVSFSPHGPFSFTEGSGDTLDAALRDLLSQTAAAEAKDRRVATHVSTSRTEASQQVADYLNRSRGGD